MKRSDMILEFIDGTLDHNGEQELFNEMAQRTELRHELRQFIMIGDAVRSDREAFTPPAEVERSLLAGLGIIPAAAGSTAAGAGGGWLVAKLGLIKGALPILTAFVIGAASAGGGVYLAMSGDGENTSTVVQAETTGVPSHVGAPEAQPVVTAARGALQNGVNNTGSNATASANGLQSSTDNVRRAQTAQGSATATVNGNTTIAANSSSPSAINGGGARASNQGTSQDAVVNNPVASNQANTVVANQQPQTVAASTSVQEGQNVDEQQTSIAAVSPVALKDDAGLGSDNVALANNGNDEGVRQYEPMAIVQPLPGEDGAEGKTEIMMAEFRKQIGTSITSNEAVPVQKSFFGSFLAEDFAMAVYFPISSSMMIGLEGGQERYAQTLFYNGVFNGEDVLFIDQQPNIPWAGFTARYNADRALVGIPLYAQATVGGALASGGPLVRGRIGAEVLSGIISGINTAVTGGLETSSMFYTYNEQWLFTSRWGFTFGLQAGF